jgi:acyl-CoA thioester hydrolase
LYRTIIEPRISETDGVGHINNTTVPVWFEAGRNKVFKLFTPEDTFDDWKLILLKMNVEFLHQIYFGIDVEVRNWIKRIGNTSFELYEEIHQDSRLCAKGTVIYVNFNFETQHSEPIPDTIRSELEKHLYKGD